MEIIATPTCNFSTLAPFEPSSQDPWNTRKINHVYRRLGFGASQDAVDTALTMSPGQFINSLVDSAHNLPPTPAPYWGFYSTNDFSDYETENFQFFSEWRMQTTRDLLAENLRGRLAFFWMNHFVTRFGIYFHAPYAYQYYHIMQVHALGNFKEFTRAVGLTPAMLIFLNGFENTNYSPNENYARELFELFTLGEGNGYTQNDITETARALTGYNEWDEPNGNIYFDPQTFDNGTKTIFGQTGNWGYNDVVDILFQERGPEIAFFICKKLYKFFVSPATDNIEQTIIQELAQTLVASNFEMVPMLKKLFKSQHFFDEQSIGVVIKSPFDVVLNFLKETDFYYDDQIIDALIYYVGLIGQEMYDPVDVAGWQRDEAWINSSTLTGRWALVDEYLDYLDQNGFDSIFVDLAKALTNNSKDPYFITKTLVDHFTSRELYTITDYDIATDIFKWEVPQNYYDQGLWSLDFSSAPYQVLILLKHIARMPEFQLK
ncbi:DUF1800 domain-containing protein [Vitellibacter sp. q18]|jgi:uncharacterized protein (DUF1800 family)|nr:DUF1800 domain-containing protein [Aequorivita lutea]